MDAIVYGGRKMRSMNYEMAKSISNDYIVIAANHWSIKDMIQVDYIAHIDLINGPHDARIRRLKEYAFDNGIKTISVDDLGSKNASITIPNHLDKKIFDSGMLATYFAINNVNGYIYLCGIDMRENTEHYSSCAMRWASFYRSLGDEVIRIKRF